MERELWLKRNSKPLARARGRPAESGDRTFPLPSRPQGAREVPRDGRLGKVRRETAYATIEWGISFPAHLGKDAPVGDCYRLLAFRSGTKLGGAMDKDAYTIPEFCQRHGISASHFFELAKQGLGPRTMSVGRRRLVSKEASAEWRRERETSSHCPATEEGAKNHRTLHPLRSGSRET